MDGHEDWLLQVVDSGLIPFSALNDPQFDLEDFVLCLEYLDVKNENMRRVKAQGKHHG